MANSTPVQVTRLLSSDFTLYGWKDPLVIDPRDPDNPVQFVLGGHVGDGLEAPVVTVVGDGSGGVEGCGVDPWDGTEEVVFIPEGFRPPAGFVEYEVQVSFRGNRGGLGTGQWGTCWTCGDDRPLGEMTKIKGHWYCHRNGCAEEQEA